MTKAFDPSWCIREIWIVAAGIIAPGGRSGTNLRSNLTTAFVRPASTPDQARRLFPGCRDEGQRAKPTERGIGRGLGNG